MHEGKRLTTQPWAHLMSCHWQQWYQSLRRYTRLLSRSALDLKVMNEMSLEWEVGSGGSRNEVEYKNKRNVWVLEHGNVVVRCL